MVHPWLRRETDDVPEVPVPEEPESEFSSPADGSRRPTAEGPSARIGGLAVYYRRQRSGDRVVFVHGSMDRSASFIKVIRRLPAIDAVRYDRRGYGRSLDVALAETVDEQVEDLVAMLGGRPSVLVGHSMGGLLALMVAERYPALVRSMVVFEAPMPWTDWWPTDSAGGAAVRASMTEGADKAAEMFMRRMIGDARWEKLPPSTKVARRSEGKALISELRAVRSGIAPYDATLVRAPLVIGSGTASDAQHQRGAETLRALVSTAELVRIEGAGHGAHASHASDFAKLVERGIERAT